MTKLVTIALIGDFNSSVTAHLAIPRAIKLAAKMNQINVQYKWLDTDSLKNDIDSILSEFQGIWCVPASPYKNMQGALSAIQYARENSIPFLGTCGGYQHAILEFARNVLNLSDADNSEVNPDTSFPLIGALQCALVEKEGEIILAENTQVKKMYACTTIYEKYHCTYGFNGKYVPLFDQSELTISGVDNDNDPRVIELSSHQFFIATAFQPERSALLENNHPLITAFINAAQRLIS